jgi:hypothetical protein
MVGLIAGLYVKIVGRGVVGNKETIDFIMITYMKNRVENVGLVELVLNRQGVVYS